MKTTMVHSAFLIVVMVVVVLINPSASFGFTKGPVATESPATIKPPATTEPPATSKPPATTEPPATKNIPATTKSTPECKLAPAMMGIDEGFKNETDLENIEDPDIPEDSGMNGTMGDGFSTFSAHDMSQEQELRSTSASLAYLQLCKSKWNLKPHGWVISRYYDPRCKCWRYRKAFAPVRILHRECSKSGQHCQGGVNGCCRQKYTWVGMPVRVRQPTCRGYRYTTQWSYIRVGACCECMANVTPNFDCKDCKKSIKGGPKSSAEALVKSPTKFIFVLALVSLLF